MSDYKPLRHIIANDATFEAESRFKKTTVYPWKHGTVLHIFTETFFKKQVKI